MSTLGATLARVVDCITVEGFKSIEPRPTVGEERDRRSPLVGAAGAPATSTRNLNTCNSA